ncbi:hypothetical protein SS05631_b50690 (plasmid) [Sinorhizobium sp. CCBAU 05631]|nr:hypothetical protein SS05631_b50690 [Sinorhizobium sp. CCBAU 05631]
MAKHRSHSVEFKRQVAQEFLAGETLHGLAKRHDVSRNLIRIWVQKYEEGAFDEDAQAVDLLQEYEARIAALERLVGKQALELEFLKGALKNAPPPKSGTTSVITGPATDFITPKSETSRLFRGSILQLDGNRRFQPLRIWLLSGAVVIYLTSCSEPLSCAHLM